MILPSTFLFAKLCFTFLKINFFIFSVWNTLGISNSQICRDIIEPMSQEFVTELNDEEVKLNEEINVLLNGIDFNSLCLKKNHQLLFHLVSLRKMDLHLNNILTPPEMSTFAHLLFYSHKKKRRKLQESLYCNLSYVQKRRKVQFFKKILWTLWKNYLLQTLGILILLMNNSTRNILNIPLM